MKTNYTKKERLSAEHQFCQLKNKNVFEIMQGLPRRKVTQEESLEMQRLQLIIFDIKE